MRSISSLLATTSRRNSQLHKQPNEKGRFGVLFSWQNSKESRARASCACACSLRAYTHKGARRGSLGHATRAFAATYPTVGELRRTKHLILVNAECGMRNAALGFPGKSQIFWGIAANAECGIVGHFFPNVYSHSGFPIGIILHPFRSHREHFTSAKRTLHAAGAVLHGRQPPSLQNRLRSLVGNTPKISIRYFGDPNGDLARYSPTALRGPALRSGTG